MQLFFITSTSEAAIMLFSQNLILSPFLPMSLKFLVHPFMVDLVPECRRLIYALGIQRNRLLCCNSFSNFLLKTQTSPFINVFHYLIYAETEIVRSLPLLLSLALFTLFEYFFQVFKSIHNKTLLKHH